MYYLDIPTVEQWVFSPGPGRISYPIHMDAFFDAVATHVGTGTDANIIILEDGQDKLDAISTASNVSAGRSYIIILGRK